MKTTVDHGLELEGSPLPQAGNSLPYIWKLALNSRHMAFLSQRCQLLKSKLFSMRLAGKGSLSETTAESQQSCWTGRGQTGQVFQRGARIPHSADPDRSQHHSPCLLSAPRYRGSFTWNTPVAALDKQIYKPKLLPISGQGMHTGAALYQR